MRSTPQFAVTFDASYADGNDGQKYGGIGKGHIDSTGAFTATWSVASGAPVGPVTVYVSVAGGQESAFRQPTFKVASSC